MPFQKMKIILKSLKRFHPQKNYYLNIMALLIHLSYNIFISLKIPEIFQVDKVIAPYYVSFTVTETYCVKLNFFVCLSKLY